MGCVSVGWGAVGREEEEQEERPPWSHGRWA